MSRNYLKGKWNMVWTFMGNARMYQALNDYGDRLDTVGMFSFNINADGAINETGVTISSLAPYRAKWPHIKWLCTCMNNGTASIFTALRENTNGSRDTFLTELVRIMNKYPWCAGVDIDLERGGGFENRQAARTGASTPTSTPTAIRRRLCPTAWRGQTRRRVPYRPQTGWRAFMTTPFPR
jgi:hypothetical protein